MPFADHRPDKSDAGELDTLMLLYQFQRASFLRKLDGLDDAAADSSPVPTGTSLRWLVAHLAHAERVWFRHRFAGEDVELFADLTVPSASLLAAIETYRDECARADEIIRTAPSLDAHCARDEGAPVNLRWVVMHMLEETARHTGHADILRELIDGSAGR